MFCLEDGDEARALFSRHARSLHAVLLPLARLDPAPGGYAEGRAGPAAAAADAGELKAGLAGGGRQIGSPEEIVEVIQMYEDIGVDQLIYAPLTLTLDQKHVLRSIETFGKHVLPKFDKDPVHSTTRQREAALAGQGGVTVATPRLQK